MALLTIGKLAQAVGVNVETIRFYQRRGLLDKPAKPPGGHRSYTSEYTKRVRFIRRAQALGFTLSEIQALLAIDGTELCRDTRELVLKKTVLIDQKISDLTILRGVLDGLIQKCESGQENSVCPIIDVLSDDI